ncbi:N-acetylmuramoyl-L-alanine amidase, partial [Clostridiaceae bacterium]|nr:N-acetylmuramoyl-L-alanine amidase [Clostridiaceae bacterium]
MGKRVFIGVGHGGSDPGACANGLRESDVNLTMALAMKTALERAGVAVGISRT